RWRPYCGFTFAVVRVVLSTTLKLVVAVRDRLDILSITRTSRLYLPGDTSLSGILPSTTTRCPEKNWMESPARSVSSSTTFAADLTLYLTSRAGLRLVWSSVALYTCRYGIRFWPATYSPLTFGWILRSPITNCSNWSELVGTGCTELARTMLLA